MANLSRLAKQKESERNRNVIADFSAKHAREQQQRQFLEERINIQNVYKKGELERRINKHINDIWYLPALAQRDISKYPEIKKSRLVDALKILELIIDSQY